MKHTACVCFVVFHYPRSLIVFEQLAICKLELRRTNRRKRHTPWRIGATTSHPLLQTSTRSRGLLLLDQDHRSVAATTHGCLRQLAVVEVVVDGSLRGAALVATRGFLRQLAVAVVVGSSRVLVQDLYPCQRPRPRPRPHPKAVWIQPCRKLCSWPRTRSRWTTRDGM